MELLNNIITVLTGIAALIVALSPVLYHLIQYIKDERLRKMAHDAVAFTEQIAGNGKWQDETGEWEDAKPPSESKFTKAAEILIEMAKKHRLKVDAQKANVLIEAVLGKEKLKLKQ
jgi:hypothetical protein